MNILHINTDNATGGAGKAASRLHTGLNLIGETSRMLVRTQNGQDADVQCWPRAGLVGQGAEYALKRYYRYGSFPYLYYPSTKNILRHPWVREANAINLHNIHGNYFAYPVLPKLTQLKPVIWTLHDMWGMTGHCGYSLECERWRTGCGDCPHLDVYPALPRDTTTILWKIKDKVYAHSRITVVTPSLWLADMAKNSPLLGRFDVHCIPNSVNTDLFRPIPKSLVRTVLNLPQDRFILLFAAHALDDARKGGDLFVAAANKLASQGITGLEILVVGKGAAAWSQKLPFKLHAFGEITSDALMAACYAAANVYVLPTRQDNLPNGFLESMACGTPCVSFDVGGVSDAVRHLKTGYLARPESADDLAQGIALLHNDPALCTRLGQQGRTVAEQEYALPVQANCYLDLYHTLTQ